MIGFYHRLNMEGDIKATKSLSRDLGSEVLAEYGE